MAITFESRPPRDDEPQRRPTAKQNAGVKSSSDRPVYQHEARAPRGRKAVYVDILVQSRLIQAAAEMGRNADDMANEAVRDYLKREAAALFEREFADADREATVSVQRWEFQQNWKAPAWGRES